MKHFFKLTRTRKLKRKHALFKYIKPNDILTAEQNVTFQFERDLYF